MPFGCIPTEQNFKTFFEASDARDFNGPADSQTISQRYFDCFLFAYMRPSIGLFLMRFDYQDMRFGIAGESKVKSAPDCFFLWSRDALPGLVNSLGHAVGSSFTLADILIFSAFGDSLSAQENPNVPPHLREPFGSSSRTQLLLRKHPKVPFDPHDFGNFHYYLLIQITIAD